MNVGNAVDKIHVSIRLVLSFLRQIQVVGDLLVGNSVANELKSLDNREHHTEGEMVVCTRQNFLPTPTTLL